VDISCAFATELATPQHIAVAESLGYHRAWCYDSPAVYPDVWMILALAAERTSRIGLGPGVLIPSLRHPMVTAAAIATLEAAAPGRVAVGIGSGFTGRVSMGRRPMRWVDVGAYVLTLQALLRGETATWEGVPLAMLHPDRCGAPRPLQVPIIIGADGPRGSAIAGEVGDGVFSANPGFLATADARQRTLLMWGTVLLPGEHPTSVRVHETLGPVTAVRYHVTYERGGAEAVDALPGGRAWRQRIEAHPADQRHLAVHAAHQIEPNDADRALFPDATPMISEAALVGDPAQVRGRLAAWAADGITEIAFQPAGPDIPGQLDRFVAAAGGGER
jgi:5,10-methylenetetrahydromethanopterin reductase